MKGLSRREFERASRAPRDGARPEGYRHTAGPNLTALYEERRPGCCLGCDCEIRQTGRGRVKVLCGARECERLYQAAYRQDRSLREHRKPRKVGWRQRMLRFEATP